MGDGTAQVKPFLSLITGTRNRPDSLARLIRSVHEHTTVPHELIIGDASDKAYRGPIDRNVLIVREVPRLGHTKGYNQCFKMARGEYVLWLNDDAEVTKDYAESAIAFMVEHPDIGLGALHYSENGGPFHVNSAWKCIYANFGILKRSFGEYIGWFDEDLWMYGSDNSITFRTLLAGKGVADIPNARILHHSVEDATRIENQSGRTRDNRILTEKYMPRQLEWLGTYQKYQVKTTSEAWSHGRQPIAR